MSKLGAYAMISSVSALVTLLHAFASRGQFYPTTRYLATSKLSLVLLLNMALVMARGLWQAVKAVFLGKLREAESEHLNEQLLKEVMEILFAIMMFHPELNMPLVASLSALLFVKSFHWLLQGRVEYMETTPFTSRISHIRIFSFTLLLFCTDVSLFWSTLPHLDYIKTASPVALLFAFEYVILAISTIATFFKYVFYICDVALEGRWESKPVFTFYLEFIRDVLHLLLYLLFFCAMCMNYGLPLHLFQQLYDTFRNFRNRVSDFIHYRKITSNMQDRFPDVTVEELSRSDPTCIICREEMSSAKKLQCGHLFHVHCLRSWLERQHKCPTCRSPVLTSENGASVEAVAPQQEHQLPREVQEPVPEQRGTIGQVQGLTVQAMNGYAPPIAYPAFHTPTNNASNRYPGYIVLVPAGLSSNVANSSSSQGQSRFPVYPMLLNSQTENRFSSNFQVLSEGQSMAIFCWQQQQLEFTIKVLQQELERNAALQAGLTASQSPDTRSIDEIGSLMEMDSSNQKVPMEDSCRQTEAATAVSSSQPSN